MKAQFCSRIVAFVKRRTGAVRVEMFDHTIRKCLPMDPKAQTTVQRPAVMLVHSDCTVANGLQRAHRFRWRQLVQVQLLFSRADVAVGLFQHRAEERSLSSK